MSRLKAIWDGKWDEKWNVKMPQLLLIRLDFKLKEKRVLLTSALKALVKVTQIEIIDKF